MPHLPALALHLLHLCRAHFTLVLELGGVPPLLEPELKSSQPKILRERTLAVRLRTQGR